MAERSDTVRGGSAVRLPFLDGPAARARDLLQPTGCGEYVRRRCVAKAVNGACPQGGLVLDLGGGPGRLVQLLRPDLRPRYTVVDIGPGGSGRRVVGDLNRPPVPDRVADVVCLSDVLEHAVDDARVVREAMRLLRPGGHLVVHVPSLRTKPFGFLRRAADEAEAADHQAFPHVRDGYEVEGLRGLLGSAGGAGPVAVEPSFSRAQSLVADLDGFLWWRRLTGARAATWCAVRVVSRVGRRPPVGSSSGFLGVVARRAGGP